MKQVGKRATLVLRCIILLAVALPLLPGLFAVAAPRDVAELKPTLILVSIDGFRAEKMICTFGEHTLSMDAALPPGSE